MTPTYQQRRNYKRRLPTLLLFFMAISTYAQETDLAKHHFRDKVKSCRGYNYSISRDTTSVNFKLNNQYLQRYTEAGNLTSKTVNDTARPLHTLRSGQEISGKLDSILHVFKEAYYDNGTYVASENYDKVSRSGQKEESWSVNIFGVKTIKKYNKRGEITGHTNINPDGIVEKEVIKMNKSGDPSEVYMFKNDTLIGSEYHKYIYDKHGNWITDNIYSKDILIYLRIRELEYW